MQQTILRHATGSPATLTRTRNQYIARAGRQTYMSGDSCGCKYLVVRLKSGRVRLYGVRMVNRLYPFEVAGRFQSNDAFLNHLWQIGVDTTWLCSEDAYVDSSTRERASWLGDGTVVEVPITRVALAGPGKDGKPWYADPRLLRQKVWQVGKLRVARRPRQGVRPLRRF